MTATRPLLALGAALVAFALAACQPVPQPFRHDEGTAATLMEMPGTRGVVVLPVADAPPATARALAEATVAELIERGVPAFTDRGNRSSLFLLGQIVDPGRDAHIAWTLQDPEGQEVARFDQSIEGTPIAPWAAAEPDLMARMGGAAAERVVAAIEPPPPVAVEDPPIFVGPVIGVGEVVAERMRAAVRQSLARLGARTSPGSSTDTLIALGEVEISGEEGDQGPRTVRVAWSLYDPHDTKIGTIRQARTLPAVEGQRDWAPVVREAGTAAAAGLYQLVQAIDWSHGFAPPPPEARESDPPGQGR